MQPEHIAKLPPADVAYFLIKQLIHDLIQAYSWEGHPYNPDWYGYTILVEPEDVDRELTELWPGCGPTNILWEGITLREGFFIAIYLANNEYGFRGSVRVRFRSTEPFRFFDLPNRRSASRFGIGYSVDGSDGSVLQILQVTENTWILFV